MPLPGNITEKLLLEYSSICGNGLTVLDDRATILSIQSPDFTVHKGEMGHCLIIAGSPGRLGAAILSTEAALRAGSGLVTTCLPIEGTVPVLCRVPEAMIIHDVKDLGKYDSVGFGPGAGLDQSVYDKLRYCLESLKPMVVDADGITVLSRHPDLVELLHENVVLTPHEKEFDRLTGRHSCRKERISTQLLWVDRYKCTIILKGMGTIVATPSGIYLNTSGNPGMATAGTGDVLTGIIAGLLAGGLDITTSATVGVYYHGKAGDMAADLRGERSMIASDLLKHLRIGH